VAGVVGHKKFAYDIWGDTVNIAARMQQSSDPGKINISEETFKEVKEKFNCIYRGLVDAKHKGKIQMYYVERMGETIFSQ
jgi:class 3 adenylate cyclase